MLCAGMMHHDCRCALLRLQQKPGSQAHSDVFFGMQKREELRLVFQMRARGIAEGIARSAILLMKQIVGARRVFACYAEFFSHLLMMKFGKRFGRLDAKSVKN